MKRFVIDPLGYERTLAARQGADWGFKWLERLSITAALTAAADLTQNVSLQLLSVVSLCMIAGVAFAQLSYWRFRVFGETTKWRRNLNIIAWWLCRLLACLLLGSVIFSVAEALALAVGS